MALGFEIAGLHLCWHSIAFWVMVYAQNFLAVANTHSYALHYLHVDDIVFVGEVSSSACGDNVEQALSTCRFLGVLVAPDKVHELARVITFLDIF